jgi:hypothetical protein
LRAFGRLLLGLLIRFVRWPWFALGARGLGWAFAATAEDPALAEVRGRGRRALGAAVDTGSLLAGLALGRLFASGLALAALRTAILLALWLAALGTAGDGRFSAWRPRGHVAARSAAGQAAAARALVQNRPLVQPVWFA